MKKSLFRILVEAGSVCGISALLSFWFYSGSFQAGRIGAALGFIFWLVANVDDSIRILDAVLDPIVSTIQYFYDIDWRIWWAHFVASFLFSSCIFVPLALFFPALDLYLGKQCVIDPVFSFVFFFVWIIISFFWSTEPNSPQFPMGYPFDKEWDEYKEELRKYRDEMEIQKKLHSARFLGLPETFWMLIDGIIWLMECLKGIILFLLLPSNQNLICYLIVFAGTTIGYFYFNDPILGLLYGGVGVLGCKIVAGIIFNDVTTEEVEGISEASEDQKKKGEPEKLKTDGPMNIGGGYY